MRLSRGVTLIEMLIVLGIIGVLSIIIVTSQGTFNKTILLNFTAYDVALTIRSAETYGLGSRIQGLADKQTGYGVHFATAAAQNTTVTLFADSDVAAPTGCHPSSDINAPDATKGNCVYQASEKVQSFTLGNGVRVSALATYSGTSGTPNARSSLDISFVRPNTRAYITAGGIYEPTSNYTKARITLASPQGGFSYICVSHTGQIRVSSTATC